MASPHPSPLTPHAVLKLGRFLLLLNRPLIMGIVNITPDSFSDGGRFFDASRALDHARQLLEDGADILDIGGESSRPGAEPVDVDEELRRVLPVLRKVSRIAGAGVGGHLQARSDAPGDCCRCVDDQ